MINGVKGRSGLAILVGLGLCLGIVVGVVVAEVPAPPQNLRVKASENQVPLAVDDSYSTGVNTTLNIPAPGVLANDTDPDGDILTAILVAGPASGNLTLNSDGSFTYQPDQGFGGSASFTYQASDGQALSGPATVIITLSADEEWLDTPHGYRLRQSRPRVLLDSKQLAVVIDRMYGPNAREPYSKWFNWMKSAQDKAAGPSYNMLDAALIYKATADVEYKRRFLASIPETGMPSEDELHGWDLLWNELSDELKIKLMQRVAAGGPHGFYWESVSDSNKAPAEASNWGYHRINFVRSALAYSGLFAYTALENYKDVEQFPFNANNFIAIASHQFSDKGYFFKIESRFGGDPTYNDALPGSYGGMYDNFGYDSYDEGFNANVFQQYRTLTGNDRYLAFVRDAARGTFYQNMTYPYKERMINTWNSASDVGSPRVLWSPLFASMYEDGRMQFYNTERRLAYSTSPNYRQVSWWLIFYDDTLAVEPPSSNPTAMYFNGPGLVTMRSSWQTDAAVGLFLAGEGVSRRFEDGNSFILGRNVDVVVQAGVRLYDSKLTWYSQRSISRNTLQIYDPDESYDIRADGTTGELHSGTPLDESQNFGGQIFKLGTNLPNLNWKFPLGIRETSNIIKYEHRPDQGYTYTVGDSTAAYTKKINSFEREFLFLRPDIFVIFDRVRSVDPSFKKVWRIHTVDQPIGVGTPSAVGMGVNTFENSLSTVITNSQNITYLETLLPRQNRVIIRGGDTILVDAQRLALGQVLTADAIAKAELDIPRRLELFVSAGDTAGSLTIHGETSGQINDLEVISFEAARHKNSVKYWKKITSISTTDMDVSELTISAPHYFDIENAAGVLHSFAPDDTTDSRYSVRRSEVGQWNLSVEASEPKQLDNFLNVFALKDPGVAKPQTTLLEGSGVSGVLVDSFFAIFANDRGNIEETAVTLPGQGAFEGLFLNLEPESEYFYRVNGNAVELSRSGSGTRAQSSVMGTLKVTVLIE